MIIVKTSVWQYLGILLYILGSSWIFKVLVKTFENDGKNISKNIVKLNLEQNTNLCCIIIWSTYVQRKKIFENFIMYLQDKPENSIWQELNLYLVITRLIHEFKTTGWFQGHRSLLSFRDWSNVYQEFLGT